VKFVFNNQLLGAWMLFHQTYNSISRCEDKEFGKLGISAQQHAILMAITRADGPVTPGQIARWVDRNANSITLMLDRMEKSGLVVRTRNVNDRRSLYVEITEKGAEVLKKSIEVGWNVIRTILGHLSAEEIKALSDSLEKLRRQAILWGYPEKDLEEIHIDGQYHLPQITKRGADKK
jgi:DNA-binding MarR family transcriptional regulator